MKSPSTDFGNPSSRFRLDLARGRNLSLTGAGSTWVYPLVAKWAAAYQQSAGVEMNYQSIGSGGGIAQIKAGTVALAPVTCPLNPKI